MLEVPGVSIDVYEPFFMNLVLYKQRWHRNIHCYVSPLSQYETPASLFCVRYFHDEYKMGVSAG